ncbi:MAG: LysR family transcriptional regulator [Candidatus Thiodiazotropha sp.]|jgi:LysR family transcriptional regulator, flagellar master operon regulator
MDTTLLKTFLEVVRTRHFGKASDALFVTQSAVSARIKLLETNLGVALFSRRRNDIQLTPAGERLVTYAETIVKNWERARREITLGARGDETLLLGCPLDLWGILLREWVSRIRAQDPDMLLQIETLPTETIISRLNNDLLDLALIFDPPQGSDLPVRQVLEIPLLLVSSEPGLNAEMAMSQDNYYLVDWGTAFARQHREYFPGLTSPGVSLASGTLAIDLIHGIGGSAYLAQQMVQDDLNEGKLYLVEDAPIIERNAFAIHRPGDERRGILPKALKLLKQL